MQISEVFAKFYNNAEAGTTRLAEIKQAHSEIAWYPFRTQDKIHLLKILTEYFDGKSDLTCMGAAPTMLDVGTADGDLAFLFEMVGCQASAIDNAPSNFNDCKAVQAMKGFLDSSVDFTEIDIDYDFNLTKQYDIVIFLDILYHLRNPMGVLINLCRAGEYMFISTRICDEAKGVNLKDLSVGYLLAPFEAARNDPTNYWIFTEMGFHQLLDRCGWVVRKQQQFGYTGTDANPYDPQKDKRLICLCQRKPGYEGLKYGHFLP